MSEYHQPWWTELLCINTGVSTWWSSWVANWFKHHYYDLWKGNSSCECFCWIGTFCMPLHVCLHQRIRRNGGRTMIVQMQLLFCLLSQPLFAWIKQHFCLLLTHFLILQACLLPAPKGVTCANYARCVNQILQNLSNMQVSILSLFWFSYFSSVFYSL